MTYLAATSLIEPRRHCSLGDIQLSNVRGNWTTHAGPSTEVRPLSEIESSTETGKPGINEETPVSDNENK